MLFRSLSVSGFTCSLIPGIAIDPSGLDRLMGSLGVRQRKDGGFVYLDTPPNLQPGARSYFGAASNAVAAYLLAGDATGRLTVVTGQPLGEHLDRLARIRALLLERLSPMTAADLHRPRHLERYDAAADWILHHLLQHEAEHRAHIALLRDTFRAGDG